MTAMPFATSWRNPLASGSAPNTNARFGLGDCRSQRLQQRAGSLNARAMNGTPLLAWNAALGLVIGYGVLAAVVAFLLFHTRDIVS